jgi:hypothetical protein
MRGVRPVVGFFLVFMLGCGARSELDVPVPVEDAATFDAHRDASFDAGLDVVDEPIPFVAVCNVPDAARPDDVCTTTIGMGTIEAPGTCVNDYAVTSGEIGTLELACDGGSNWAAVTFQGQTFPGSVQNGYVDVCIGTTFPWQDGADCDWGKSVWSTAQRIFGDYTTGMLTYTYADEMIHGHSCWVPCFAWADVNVQ